MLFYGARHFTYFLHCTGKEFKFAAVMISLFLLLYIDELMDLSSISFLTFTMEGESELRASDAFIAKWLITSEIFSLCNCGCKVFNLKIRP